MDDTANTTAIQIDVYAINRDTVINDATFLAIKTDHGHSDDVPWYGFLMPQRCAITRKFGACATQDAALLLITGLSKILEGNTESFRQLIVEALSLPLNGLPSIHIEDRMLG